MILALDMGNTQIELGVCNGKEVCFSERIATDRQKTDLEYAVLIESVLRFHDVAVSDVDGSIISSVVPPLTDILKGALKKVLGRDPLVVGPGLKNGLKIAIDDPKQLGADMVVDAVGAIEEYGAPVVIIDMGTATTVSAIDEKQRFLGGAIIPGLRASMNALVSDTSQLQLVSLEAPDRAIGANTVDCMKSGLILGHASLLDGMIDRIMKELGTEAVVVATGGTASRVIPYCSHEIIHDPKLMIKGLLSIYERNRK